MAMINLSYKYTWLLLLVFINSALVAQNRRRKNITIKDSLSVAYDYGRSELFRFPNVNKTPFYYNKKEFKK